VRDGHRSPIRRTDLRPYVVAGAPDGPPVLSPVDHAVAGVLLRDAAWAEPEITARLRRVAQDLGTELLQPEHARKGAGSLKRKVATDLPEDRGDITVVGRKLRDSVRYAVAVPDDVYATRTLAAVGTMRRNGFRLTTAKARWGDEGYRGTNLTFLDPRTGRLLELQLHTLASWGANVATHKDYEIVRDLSRPQPERDAAGRRLAALYEAVPSPPGVATLQTQLDRRVDVDQRSMRPPAHRLPAVRAGGAVGGAAGAAASGAASGSASGGAGGRPQRVER
jgi:hypothetical protein